MSFQEKVKDVLAEIETTLVEKNRKYGDSALNPIRVFARSDAVEQIKVRIDDKLKRLQNQQDDDSEDTIRDLMGYLVLLRLALPAHTVAAVREDLGLDAEPLKSDPIEVGGRYRMIKPHDSFESTLEAADSFEVTAIHPEQIPARRYEVRVGYEFGRGTPMGENAIVRRVG